MFDGKILCECGVRVEEMVFVCLVLVAQNAHCIDFGPGKSGSTVMPTDTLIPPIYKCHLSAMAYVLHDRACKLCE